MSIDLTAAVEAAAVAWFDRTQAGRKDDGRLNPQTGAPWTFADLPPIDQHAAREIALPLVAAAAPLIAGQIAREIEAEAETYGSQSAVDTFRIAARIARKAVTR